MNDDRFYPWPAPDLSLQLAKKLKKNPGITHFEVTYPVSMSYNGGTVIDDKWYAGYKVPAPIVPVGWQLKGIGAGLELNAHPMQQGFLKRLRHE